MRRKMLDLPARIKELRKTRGWNQGDLAARCGVKRESVTQWESGATKNIRNETLLALADAFSISVDELLTGEKSSCVQDAGGKYETGAATPEELEVLEQFRRLVPYDRSRIVIITKALADHPTQA